MSGLVGIIYAWDSSGKPLTIMVSPDWVTSTQSTPTSFSISSKSVNSFPDLSVSNPGKEAYGTSYNFVGPTGSGNFMSKMWDQAVNKVTVSQTFEILDFISQGYTMQKRILIYP